MADRTKGDKPRPEKKIVEGMAMNISNGGVGVRIEDRGYGPEVVFVSSYFGAASSEFRFKTCPDSLLAMSDLFRTASEFDFSQTYFHACKGGFSSRKSIKRWKEKRLERRRQRVPSAMMNDFSDDDYDKLSNIDVRLNGKIIAVIRRVPPNMTAEQLRDFCFSGDVHWFGCTKSIELKKEWIKEEIFVPGKYLKFVADLPRPIATKAMTPTEGPANNPPLFIN